MSKVILQNADKFKSLPPKRHFQLWADQVLAKYKKNYELVIRLVGTKEITALNKKYRKKNKPTNIISFQFEPPLGIQTDTLGDLVICIPLVRQEAKKQQKTFAAHLAHLTIHGVLHLLGYDHQTDEQAEKMEALERKYLKQLNIPYS